MYILPVIRETGQKVSNIFEQAVPQFESMSIKAASLVFFLVGFCVTRKSAVEDLRVREGT